MTLQKRYSWLDQIIFLMRSFVCKLFPALEAHLMQPFCILSLTIHPPTITASIFAVQSFLASGAIGKGVLVSSVFDMLELGLR